MSRYGLDGSGLPLRGNRYDRSGEDMLSSGGLAEKYNIAELNG